MLHTYVLYLGEGWFSLNKKISRTVYFSRYVKYDKRCKKRNRSLGISCVTTTLGQKFMSVYPKWTLTSAYPREVAFQ